MNDILIIIGGITVFLAVVGILTWLIAWPYSKWKRWRGLPDTVFLLNAAVHDLRYEIAGLARRLEFEGEGIEPRDIAYELDRITGNLDRLIAREADRIYN